ncbi:MAG TPA: hypothetical protein VK553_10470 [Candidatus Nitrosopolaris rasttigaisensis]|nr:hypothetical protein [Candidatus Nitrosopolaris rasttigaisensis]
MTNEEFKAKWEEKQYLSDGVYAWFDGYHIWLETLEGNKIALEPDCIKLFGIYDESLRKDIRRVMKLGEFSATDKWYKDAAESETDIDTISAVV